jgi:HlyD family secretion protein
MSMDRKIERLWYQKRQTWWMAGGGLIVLVLAILIWTTDSQSRLNVETERITISTVERGPFQVYIPLTGSVMPIRTVFLDAMEGGRVEAVIKEAGSFVNEGDTILHLSNSSLLLDIMNREAQLFEQSNNLRNTRLAMQQNALQIKGELLELDRQIKIASRAWNLQKTLMDKQQTSKDAFDNAREDFDYLTQKRELTLENQRQDSLFRTLQVEMLESSVNRIQGNLELVRQNMAALYLRAPVTGQLTSLNAQIGESKMRGERLGQVDILDGFKVRAGVDEHYITRLDTNLHGECDLAGKTYELSVTRVYPEVRDGRFDVDLEFVGETPSDIRRGQTIHVRLELSDETECVLLPRGGFYQNTGGRWAFVVDPSGDFAVKREIRLGQQNPRMFEVLEGLQPGDRVVTSTYDNFGTVDKLVLND